MAGTRWAAARGKLIVSCQASAGDAFCAAGEMARFARAAEAGGAGAIRCHGPADVASIRAAVDLPVLAIHKEIVDDGSILITPSFERAQALADAGADAIALDCTKRGIARGALDRLRRIRAELKLPVMADIATIEEAEAAAAAGADFVLSTMRGFTADTRHLAGRFEPEFIVELVRRLQVPVIAEGRIGAPSDARDAIQAGAWAVVVGTAITRPHEITRAYAAAVARAHPPAPVAAIDLGATNIKAGIVAPDGSIGQPFSVATPDGGPEAILQRLCEIARRLLQTPGDTPGSVAVGTAGWVDQADGSIIFATGNLTGWTGTPLRARLESAAGLPVFVENDAICAAAGEWLYGEARGATNALCVTLGTGIGGGAIVEGRLQRGARGLANALGHIPLPLSSQPCCCGLSGCFEAEAGKRGAARIAARFESLEEWTAAVRANDPSAMDALSEYASLLAQGLVPAIHLLDPEVLVLSGGIATAGANLVSALEEALAQRVLVYSLRRLSIRLSQEGQYAGVRGAAAMARLRMREAR